VGLTSHGLTNLLHLLRANVVDAHEEALRVLLEQVLKATRAIEILQHQAPQSTTTHLDAIEVVLLPDLLVVSAHRVCVEQRLPFGLTTEDLKQARLQQLDVASQLAIALQHR
jgi:hypothetical protein